MRQLKIIMITLLLALALSCSKKDEITKEKAEIVTISKSDTLEYGLGSFGDEEGASIQQQASHFQISELEREVNTGEIIYRYKADSAYIGTDYVELKSARGSDGASLNDDIIITKLTIKVEQ